MNTKQAYNAWSEQYDTNVNKTRDLEAAALRETLQNMSFTNCLEIGCGTGKNTEWLRTKSNRITAVDLSEEMLTKAKEKINSDKVQFVHADITGPWTFTKEQHDFVTFSLVLEHIENLDHIFSEVSKVISKDGMIYIGELHPFKQYLGTKARFETEAGIHVLQCYNHNISDFINSAVRHGFVLTALNEYFDDGDRTTVPRIVTILFTKQ